MFAYRTPGGPPSAPEPAPPRVSVCRGCGVVAPVRGTACEVCARPLAETRVTAPPQADGTYWVAVRCGFTCNSCKFLAPLDALDAGGAVECAHCGLRQRFEVSSWAPALDLAHAVGDLAGPSPEGRSPHPTLWIGSENPYARLGDTRTFEQAEEGALSIEAAPGHPVCHACHAPLAVSVTGPGTVATRCPQCGTAATYALADAARALSPAVVAAVADEHRTDRPRAQVSATETGVIALSCPSCGGPLGLGEGGRVQTCAFCKAACVVPARSLMRARSQTPAPDVWWILFQGPSAKRRALEAPTDDATSKVLAAKNLLVPRRAAEPIGDAPGVYDAPEVPGIYWPQVALTAALGTAAVVIGMILYEVFAG
jgi:hypothetical protein